MPSGRPPIGGYQRDPRIPRPGEFIRDSLINGEVTWAHKLYREYRDAVRAVPLRRGRGTRKGMSYESFRRYLHGFRQLNLIEYVTDEAGHVEGSLPELTGGDLKMPRNYFQMVPGAAGSSVWSNMWSALAE